LTLYVIALFLPVALIPQFQLMLNLGLYNNPVGYVMLFLVNPIGVVILVNYIKTLPLELDEAAAMDGCGYVRYILYIVFPLSRPVIATVVVIHAIGIWNELILATTSRDLLPVIRRLKTTRNARIRMWGSQDVLKGTDFEKEVLFQPLETLLGIQSKNVAVYIDFENIAISLNQQGFVVNLDHLIERFVKQAQAHGHVVKMAAYAPLEPARDPAPTGGLQRARDRRRSPQPPDAGEHRPGVQPARQEQRRYSYRP
ncbi:carbohydrate ABC transporter permease, partial [bacterium]|nr:carbohydrate ABC transporter permease [bacterium]